jgi:hypothetical protein
MRPSRGPRPDAALTMNRVSMEVNWLVSRREPGSRPVRRYCWTVDTPPPGSTSLPSAASAAASSDPLITTVTRRWARRPSDGVARSNCVLSPVAGWAVPGRVVARRQPDYCSRVTERPRALRGSSRTRRAVTGRVIRMPPCHARRVGVRHFDRAVTGGATRVRGRANPDIARRASKRGGSAELTHG